jgi:hypothetical protein
VESFGKIGGRLRLVGDRLIGRVELEPRHACVA